MCTSVVDISWLQGSLISIHWGSDLEPVVGSVHLVMSQLVIYILILSHLKKVLKFADWG